MSAPAAPQDAALGMTFAHAGAVVSRSGRAALPIGALFALWVAFTHGSWAVQPLLLPPPETVASTFVRLAREPFADSTLLGHVGASVNRWGRGFLVAAAVGIPFGIGLASLRTFRALVMPIFEVVRYIPPFAWIPIMIVWFGASTAAQAAVVFIACFPPLVLNTERGIRAVDPVLYRAARNLGAGTGASLRRVAVPTSLPTIVVGMRIALSNGWMALMAAELIVGKQGLGFLIIAGQQNGNTSAIIVGMIVIGLIGVSIDGLIRALASRAIRWRKGVEAHG